jgi:disulfide bond formation protein DsbB
MDKKFTLIFLAIASISGLIFAYVSQYGFDLQPCILCLYQRKPFFAIIAVTLASLVFFKSENSKKTAIFLCGILLLINCAIAFYHVGVEQKIFRATEACSSENLNNLTNLEDLKAALINAKLARCDEPEFFFLGLTMAAWNLIYCLILLTITIFHSSLKLGKLRFLKS